MNIWYDFCTMAIKRLRGWEWEKAQPVRTYRFTFRVYGVSRQMDVSARTQHRAWAALKRQLRKEIYERVMDNVQVVEVETIEEGEVEGGG